MAKPGSGSIASIQARLKNVAKENDAEYQTLLERYAVEGVVERLAKTDYKENFLLKGGALVIVWDKVGSRVTRDVDFTGIHPETPQGLQETLREVLAKDVGDGIEFDLDAITVSRLQGPQVAGGQRVKTHAQLGNIRIPIVIDVGFDPDRRSVDHRIDMPKLLGGVIPSVRAYTPELVIAEKLHAMVDHGIRNSRLKDYYDLYILPRSQDISDKSLAIAICDVFGANNQKVPIDRPEALSREYFTDGIRKDQWARFVELQKFPNPPTLECVCDDIWTTIRPALIANH